MHDARTTEFHRLHETGTFVMPNPWDAGSAVTLERMGFPALASTSAGAAWSRGRPDTGLTLADSLEHLRALAAAVAVPVNADFEGGYAVEPAQVHANVLAATGTGIAGLSIEDSTGDAERPLHDRALAVERVAAARQAVAPKPVNLLINAPFITVAEAAELGVRRISVGGTLARAAWGGWLAAAEEIRDGGTFTAFQQLPDVDGMLGAQR